MGIKAIKEFYKIEHIVTLQKDGNIYIGSPMMHNITVITPEGKILKDYNSDGSNKDLTRYANEIKTSPLRFEQLYRKVDPIGPIAVYMIEDRTIVRHTADQFGWPHVTDDGVQQHENTVYPTYREAREELIASLWKYGTGAYSRYQIKQCIHDATRSIRILSQHLWTIISSWPLLAYHLIKTK